MAHEVLENGDILIRPTPPIRVRLWERDPCCCWCGFLFIHPDFATIEHLQFRSRGGKRTMDNCRLACLSCNNGRASWYNKVFARKYGKHCSLPRGKRTVPPTVVPAEPKLYFRAARVRAVVY